MENFIELNPQPHFTNELPGDPEEDGHSREVQGACFSYVKTKSPGKPTLVYTSEELLKEMELNIGSREDFTAIVSGAKPFPGVKPFAMCYGGHQFGHWAGQLGDGRAINIAELAIKDKNWTFQLKGAGPTPYSRRADGFAVLRSSIREFLCSEAMHHLGVPTTRALSLVKTGDRVMRDMLYDGNPEFEEGAIVCRVAPSFVRFGSFEIFSSRQELDVLKQLADFTIKHDFPHLGAPSKETYLQFFEEVVHKTREMIVHWQRVGFVHGVMNTDNLSILGLTIDYGPYGWLENYDPNWTPNTTDAQHHRYRFGNQAKIALWNLLQLANALFPLIEEVKPLEDILQQYQVDYLKDYQRMMAAKLGLFTTEIPEAFITQLTQKMAHSELDMTLFFREMSKEQSEFSVATFWEIVQAVSYQDQSTLLLSKDDWVAWFEVYQGYMAEESLSSSERALKMKAVNPKYVLRNYMAQLAIDAAGEGDYGVIDELYKLLRNPYSEQPEMEKWYAKRPDWAKTKVGCSMLSCSS